MNRKAFHVMAKPTGAICNCAYRFFQTAPEVTIGWQGGEPALTGLDFYRCVMAAVEKCRRRGTTIRHTIQTNGFQLNEERCGFLRGHNSLSWYRRFPACDAGCALGFSRIIREDLTQ
jgi:sulfatase maturation enzyme AslB (radical SAM superfamily)